jgi:hypothetical protein
MFGPRRYFLLLISLCLLTVIAPLVEHNFWERATTGAMVLLTLLTASLSASVSKKLTASALTLAVLCGVTWILTFVIRLPILNTTEWETTTYFLILLFLVTTCGIIRKDIYSGDITGNRICGAVCFFVLVGFAFAMVHMMIVLNDPGAYRNYSNSVQSTESPVLRSDDRYAVFVYFSMCTITTVGYGDIVPVSRIARTVSWLEALTGQLYLAVMMARLVGMHLITLRPDD